MTRCRCLAAFDDVIQFYYSVPCYGPIRQISYSCLVYFYWNRAFHYTRNTGLHSEFGSTSYKMVNQSYCYARWVLFLTIELSHVHLWIFQSVLHLQSGLVVNTYNRAILCARISWIDQSPRKNQDFEPSRLSDMPREYQETK